LLTSARIHQALDGDRAALSQLVRELLAILKVEIARFLHRWARSQRRDAHQDVDDFAHDILLYLLAERGRVLRTWDPERGTLVAFLRMIARQRVSRTLLRHRGNPWSDEPTEFTELEPQLEPDPAARMLESREYLRSLLVRLRAELTERGLLLFHQIYIEERPIAEVATEFGMTRQAVDAWNNRTRNLARRLAADLPAEGQR
jgi:RNA polymerase sigma factor (sigma-70 family)